jgi:hypothetical protein
MFTLRIERVGNGESSRTVYACARHEVAAEADAVRVLMHGVDGGGPQDLQMEVTLRGRDRAFAMNSYGQTIDRISAPRERR